jgi:hypothetical protein
MRTEIVEQDVKPVGMVVMKAGTIWSVRRAIGAQGSSGVSLPIVRRSVRPQPARISRSRRTRMNHEQYLQWESDARLILLAVYDPNEVNKILQWFRGIKGDDERQLVGSETVDMLNRSIGDFSLYRSLMIRVWYYAPYILAED